MQQNGGNNERQAQEARARNRQPWTTTDVFDCIGTVVVGVLIIIAFSFPFAFSAFVTSLVKHTQCEKRRREDMVDCLEKVCNGCCVPLAWECISSNQEAYVSKMCNVSCACAWYNTQCERVVADCDTWTALLITFAVWLVLSVICVALVCTEHRQY